MDLARHEIQRNRMNSMLSKRRVHRLVALPAILAVALFGCATIEPPAPQTPEEIAAELQFARATSVFGPEEDFKGSALEDVGAAELYPVRGPAECEIAMLESGEGSFAARMEMLRGARHSIRIQALVFKGDESGLRIAEVLKQKKAEGVDVRVIVDAFSNPWLQTQWLFFDLKQHGIEVEGYEALALQWINEVPIPFLMPHYDAGRADKRFHEKLWLIDAETDQGFGVTGGLNIGNEYFRVDPTDPAGYWRDQDVAVRGAILADLAAAFDHTFDYLVEIKESRGVFNTNLYWSATRSVLDETGKYPVDYETEERLVKRVEVLERGQTDLEYLPSRCRFLHNRPRFAETYILQAYLKMIAAAQHELYIANAYFVPTPAITAALKDAAQRCVSVTLVTNSPQTNDLPEISMVGRGHYKDLLAVNTTPQVSACANSDAGIHIWEWIGRAEGDPVQQGTMHSKFAVADGHLSLVGSYNLDPRSERLNSETALVFDERTISSTLARWITEHDLRYSRPVTVADAAEFADPEDTIYRFRAEIGHLFEEEL
jgi:phosphatidylserine/phosphatidylglycerophosphate/cardiolipin synthase-like enzyme